MKKYTPEKKNKEEEHKSKKDSPNQNPKKKLKIKNGMKKENNTMLPLMLFLRLNKLLWMPSKIKDHSYKLILNKLCSLKFLKYLPNTQNNITKELHGTQSSKS